MAITNVGKNRVYASIKDLPENQSIVNGDRIIIDTEEGTCLVDYSKVKIDLEHTSFGEQFSQMVDYTSSVTAFMNQMEEDFSSLKEETASLTNKVSDLESQMDAVKMLIQLIMGSYAGEKSDAPDALAKNELSNKGLALYNECMMAMDGKDFTFSRYNLYQGRVGS